MSAVLQKSKGFNNIEKSFIEWPSKILVLIYV
jgi:hypothetical protein